MLKPKNQSTLTPSLKGGALIFRHSPYRVRGENAEKSNVLVELKYKF
jgi:hypothetical protein